MYSYCARPPPDNADTTDPHVQQQLHIDDRDPRRDFAGIFSSYIELLTPSVLDAYLVNIMYNFVDYLWLLCLACFI